MKSLLEQSKPLKDSFFTLLIGLGLPVPAKGRLNVWGYKRQGDWYFPVQKDLDILATAFEMLESGDYYVEDVVNWLIAAPTSNPVSRRNFFYIREKRPLFPEYRLPYEERVKIVNGFTSPTFQEVQGQESIGQTELDQGTPSTPEGNGEAEAPTGTEEG